MDLLLLALAPVLVIALYIYFRDKYEKEPISLLIRALGTGILIVLPIDFAERLLVVVRPNFFHQFQALYNAFIVAGFTEELFKFIGLYLLIWANNNFNEKFDGIVYAVFVSLGFAAVENILYVFHHGIQVGYVRAIISVPAHALFGITMGYYFGLARFLPSLRKKYLMHSFLYPFLLHGIFDFILMLGNYFLLLGFIPYMVYLYISGLKRMKALTEESVFKS
jgi:protease PrsW